MAKVGVVNMALEKIRSQIADLQRAEAAIVAAFGDTATEAVEKKPRKPRKKKGLPAEIEPGS